MFAPLTTVPCFSLAVARRSCGRCGRPGGRVFRGVRLVFHACDEAACVCPPCCARVLLPGRLAAREQVAAGDRRRARRVLRRGVPRRWRRSGADVHGEAAYVAALRGAPRDRARRRLRHRPGRRRAGPAAATSSSGSTATRRCSRSPATCPASSGSRATSPRSTSTTASTWSSPPATSSSSSSPAPRREVRAAAGGAPAARRAAGQRLAHRPDGRAGVRRAMPPPPGLEQVVRHSTWQGDPLARRRRLVRRGRPRQPVTAVDRASQ